MCNSEYDLYQPVYTIYVNPKAQNQRKYVAVIL